MKSPWHEQIQRFIDGQLSAEESAALVQALTADPELRLLYLDYVNLDAALKAVAGAPQSTVRRAGAEAEDPSPARPRWVSSPRHWWFPAAAGLALILLGIRAEYHARPPHQPSIGAVTTAAQQSIARLSVPIPTPIPSWMSPTDPLLKAPAYPQR